MKIGRVPQSFIDELINRTDIVDLIDSRVHLKKAGNNYKACCPFHDEKTPSFNVSQTKQFYYCFGCGAHGNVIGFLMAYDHLSFPEAIVQLAQMYGMELPKQVTVDIPKESSQPLYDVTELAVKFYCQNLKQHAARDVAINYLKERGLSGELAKDYMIGYAPKGWDNLCQYLQGLGCKLEDAEKAGLVIKHKEGHYYDRFRHRIMFPIRDRRGRFIAFGGRVIDPEDNPKYLNSPETDIFHKQQATYGLFEALNKAEKPNYFLVVEGYMDVVALAQFGLSQAIATLGTALSNNHLTALFREVPHVYFCFDGDAAGRKAAWRALEISLPTLTENRQISFLFMPEGEDPDSCIRQEGLAGFEERLEKAVPLSEYLLEELATQHQMTSIDGRSNFVAALLPFVEKIPNKVLRHLLAEQIAKKSKSELNHVLQLMGEQQVTTSYPTQSSSRPYAKKQKRKVRPVMTFSQSLSPLESALSILLQQPKLANLPAQKLESLRKAYGKEPIGELLLQVLELFNKYPHLGVASILEMWRDSPEEEYLARLAAKQWLIPEENLQAEIIGAIDKALNDSKKLQADALLQKVEKLDLNELSEEDKIAIKQMFAEAGGETEEPR